MCSSCQNEEFRQCETDNRSSRKSPGPLRDQLKFDRTSSLLRTGLSLSTELERSVGASAAVPDDLTAGGGLSGAAAARGHQKQVGHAGSAAGRGGR